MFTTVLIALAGAVIAAVVGTFWYSNATPMGKIHMRYLGMDSLTEEERKKKMEEAKPMMPKMYAGQLALSFLTSFAVVFIVTTSMRNNTPFVMAVGFIAMGWLCYMVPMIGSGILWSNCDRKIAWQKFFSDIFENLVTVLLIAFLAGFFA